MATNNRPQFLTRSVLTIGFSESVSNIGNWITMMAVFALLVFRGNGGVLESGGIMLAGLLPILIGSPIAGWLCDRFDRRRLMIGSELTSAVLVSVLIFTRSLVFIYPVLALQAFVSSVMTPARRSVLPTLVPKEQLSRANAFFQQLSGSIKMGAPLLAGALLAVMNPHMAIALDVLSFVVSALLLSRLPSLPPAEGPAGEAASPDRAESVPGQPNEAAATAPSGRGEATTDAGRQSEVPVARVVWSSVGLRLIFAAAFLGIAVVVGFDVLASVFVRDVLGSGESIFGLLVSLIGVGTVGVAVLIMARSTDRDPWADVILGILLLSVIPLSFAFAYFLPSGPIRIIIAVAGCLIGGAGNGLLNVQMGTLLQLQSPARQLGRVSGAYQSTAVAGQLLGILLTPALVPGLVSMGLYFAAAFIALSILVLWVVYNLRVARNKVGAVAG